MHYMNINISFYYFFQCVEQPKYPEQLIDFGVTLGVRNESGLRERGRREAEKRESVCA